VVEVEVARAESRRVPVAVEATGSFLADEAADAASEADGIVVETLVEVGQRVRKGEALFRLDDRAPRLRLEQAEAALRQAEARLGLEEGGRLEEERVAEVAAARANAEAAEAQAKLAQADAERYTALYRSGDVSKSVVEAAETRAKTTGEQARAARKQYEAALNAARQGYSAVEAARAQAALARKAVEDTVVRAPFTGHVTGRNVAVGEYVGAMNRTSKVVRVARIDPIKARLQVPEGEAGKLRVGQKVVLTARAHPGRRFEGRVTAINPAVDAASRSITVEATLANPEGLALPGMFAAGRIEQAAEEEAVYVPRRAVTRDPNTESYRVYVVEGGKARLRVVQLGRGQEGELVEVATGIGAGEAVAASNLERLTDGAQVKAKTGG
jgi:RND family efflux transporter MFP subunit